MLIAAGVCVLLTILLVTANVKTQERSAGRPQVGGYFQLVPAEGFSSLPSDAQAAAVVHRSSWEPRKANVLANVTVPPSSFRIPGYSGMRNHESIFGRVTGDFTGTTDEIIQWTAAKWGLPDDIIRAVAVDESDWYQDHKDALGKPIKGNGYGDFGDCGGSPPGSGYGSSGPSSFGLLQVKYCALRDHGATNLGGWPWTEQSTAFAADLYGAVIRGCFQGWDTWLGGTYRAGDLWGCLGRWYSGQWYSPDARAYISRVRNYYTRKPWLGWPG